MSKRKAAFVMILFVLGGIGLFYGLTLQVSFEPTSEARMDAEMGKAIMIISAIVLLYAFVLVKLRNGKLNK